MTSADVELVLPSVGPGRFEGRGGEGAVPGWGPLVTYLLSAPRRHPIPGLLATPLHHVPLVLVYPVATPSGTTRMETAWALHAPVAVIPVARRIGYALSRGLHEQTSFGVVALEFLARSGVPVERVLLMERMLPSEVPQPRAVNEAWWAGLASALSPRVNATFLNGPLEALLLRLERNDLS